MATWLSCLVISAAILTQPKTTTTGPARAEVKVEGIAADSPEGEYLAFYNAVRAGKAEEALRHARPLKPAARDLALAQFKFLAAVEEFKWACAAQFGPPSEPMNAGMLPPESVRTVQAEIKGDAAKLTMVAPDTGKREGTEIDLKRESGKWRVSAFDAAGPGEPAAEDSANLPDDELRHQTALARSLTPMVAQIAKDVRAKKYAKAEDARHALDAAMMKAMGGGE